MKTLLFCVIVVSWTLAPTAISFERVVGGTDFDRGIFPSQTRDGGYVVVGLTRSFGEGSDDVYLVKTDSAGDVVWADTFGGSASDAGWSVHERVDGLTIVGFTDSFGAGGFDCYLIRTDPEGQMQWSRTFGGHGKDRCWAFLPTIDGGQVLVGETTSYGEGAEDCYLIKTDALGVEEWSETYGGEEGDRCFSIAPVEDGGYILAGQTFSEGEGDRDAYLIRTDPNGKKLWSKTFGGAASDVAHGVSRTAEGDFIVTGYTTSFADELDDPYLIRIDADGQTLWSRVIPMDGVAHTLTGEQTVDGGFIFGGFSRPWLDGPDRAILVKTDSNGDLAWSSAVFGTTTEQSFGYTVRATSDGGAILAGHTTKGSAGDADLFIVKVGTDGQ